MSTLPPFNGFPVREHLSWAQAPGVLVPHDLPAVPDVTEALCTVLDRPLGLDGPALAAFRPGDTVAIAVPDASRKAGVPLLLPPLLARLASAGVREEDIFFFFALGVHRPATDEEQSRILGGQIYARFKERCRNHDAHNAASLVRVGRTVRGTDVYLNRQVCECARLILVGSVVPHYFAGFGGGRKALVPGLSGAQTIAHNHALNLHPVEPRLNPDVRIAVLDGNPVAEDLLEAARFHPPDFIINTVLTADGDIGAVFAGEMDAAHRAACALAARVFCVPVQERADLVIASIADAPNFIQSHKALVNAFAALKPGGRIVLYAPAPEGLGGAGYRRYLEMGAPESVIASLRRQADINGQTALSTLQKGPDTLMVTDLPESEVRLLGAEKADGMEDALLRAREYLAARGINRPTCMIMPRAGITVPLPRD